MKVPSIEMHDRLVVEITSIYFPLFTIAQWLHGLWSLKRQKPEGVCHKGVIPTDKNAGKCHDLRTLLRRHLL